MTIYILTNNQDPKPQIFIRKKQAQKAMQDEWEASIISSKCLKKCDETDAIVYQHPWTKIWHIEEYHIPVEIAVATYKGIIQNIYANADVSTKVFTTDDNNEKQEFSKYTNTPGWQKVW